jgi:hypothetical protein
MPMQMQYKAHKKSAKDNRLPIALKSLLILTLLILTQFGSCFNVNDRNILSYNYPQNNKLRGWQRLSEGQAMDNSLESCFLRLTYNLTLTTYYFFTFQTD